MFKVRLTKIKNNHNKLRDDVIEGQTHNMPTLNKSFFLFSEGRDMTGTRMVSTNLVVRIIEGNEEYAIFETASKSVYRVDKYL